MGIQAVTNNLRTNEHDQLRTGPLFVLVREGITQMGNFIQQWNAIATSVLVLADQPGKQHRLSAGDRDRTLHPPLGDSRRQAGRRQWSDVADLLLDLESDVAVG